MAKAPTLSLKSEDFPDLLADYPEIDAFLRNLNRFGGAVAAALNRGLTLSENLAVQVADIEASAPIANLSVALKLPAGRKVQGVTVISGRDVTSRVAPTGLGAAPWVDWREDGGSLIVEAVSGLTSGNKYTLRLLIWGQ